MTEFVSSFWFNQLLPPWDSTGARGWVFVLEVPREAVQEYLDREFNLAAPDRAPYRYEAFPGQNYGILRFIDHPDFRSGKQTIEGMNRITHKELTWTFPAYRHAVTKDNLVHPKEKIVWIQPFSFDNNSYLMFSGREIMGNETQMAVIESEEALGRSRLRVDVGVQGMRKFEPSATSHKIGAFAIGVAEDAYTEDGAKLVESSEDLSRFIGTLSGSVEFEETPTDDDDGLDSFSPVSPFAAFSGATMDTVKQFRDVFDWDVAAYRALVSSRLRFTNVSKVEYFDGKFIDLHLMWSDSMKETFERFLGVETPPENSDPRYPLHSALPSKDEIDWRMPSVRKEVALAISFMADAEINIEGTLYTYGQTG